MMALTVSLSLSFACSKLTPPKLSHDVVELLHVSRALPFVSQARRFDLEQAGDGIVGSSVCFVEGEVGAG